MRNRVSSPAEILGDSRLRCYFLMKALSQFYYIEQSNIIDTVLEKSLKRQEIEEVGPCSCKVKKKNEDIPENNGATINCGEDCLNRSLAYECSPENCPCGDYCRNMRFQRMNYSQVWPIPTQGKGYGLYTAKPMKRDSLIAEYVGEVFDRKTSAGHRRMKILDKYPATYLMQVTKSMLIDPVWKGNLARFMNHSCKPNCQPRKYIIPKVGVKIGLFTIRDIEPFEELTFDYGFDVLHTRLLLCLCGAQGCRGFLGLLPQDDIEEESISEQEECTACVATVNISDNEHFRCIVCRRHTHRSCTPEGTHINSVWTCNICVTQARASEHKMKEDLVINDWEDDRCYRELNETTVYNYEEMYKRKGIGVLAKIIQDYLKKTNQMDVPFENFLKELMANPKGKSDKSKLASSTLENTVLNIQEIISALSETSKRSSSPSYIKDVEVKIFDHIPCMPAFLRVYIEFNFLDFSIHIAKIKVDWYRAKRIMMGSKTIGIRNNTTLELEFPKEKDTRVLANENSSVYIKLVGQSRGIRSCFESIQYMVRSTVVKHHYLDFLDYHSISECRLEVSEEIMPACLFVISPSPLDNVRSPYTRSFEIVLSGSKR